MTLISIKQMKAFITSILILLTLNVIGQNLDLVQPLEDKGAFPIRECKKDNDGNYCAVIHIIIPDVSFNIHAEYMIEEEKSITNGKEIFVSTANKKKIRVNAEGFQPYEFDAKELKSSELYEIRLQKPTKTKKEYLILRLNEADAKIEINGKPYIADDKEFMVELDYGTYDIYVSKPNFQMEYLQITLNDKKPVIKDVILRQKNRYGSLIVKIKGRYGANIYLDNNLINSGKIYSGLYGSHNLRLTCGNKTKDKTINIKPNKNVVKKYRFVNPYGGDNDNSFFIGGRYSLKSTIGLSLGYGKKFGAIVNLGISPYAIDRMQNNKNFAENFTLKSIYPSVLLDYEQNNSANSKGVSRSYLHCGPMYRPFDWLAFYITAGFGNYADVIKYDSLYFAPKIHHGIDGEVGVMLKYKRLGFSLGYQRNIGRKSQFNDFVAGVFVWLGK